jgi:hypothetical protein
MSVPYYRSECKYVISFGAKQALQARLEKILPKDENAQRLPYLVKSLYFDSAYDQALSQCLAGESGREKFRLRYYNNNTGFIRLEKKVKEGQRGYKLSTQVSMDEARQLIQGDIAFIKERDDQLLLDFALKSKLSLLRPRIVMDYLREAYVYQAENTRVTIDYRMRSYLCSGDYTQGFFDVDCPFIAEDHGKYLLEVKYDRYLPEIVHDLVQIGETSSTSNSKYVLGRTMNRI